MIGSYYRMVRLRSSLLGGGAGAFATAYHLLQVLAFEGSGLRKKVPKSPPIHQTRGPPTPKKTHVA